MQTTTPARPAPDLKIVPGMRKGRWVVLQAPVRDEGREHALKFWPAWGGYLPHAFCSSCSARAGGESLAKLDRQHERDPV